VNGRAKIADGTHPTGCPKFLPGMIEIEQHDDTGLNIESSKREQTDPRCDTPIMRCSPT
jgi:hypothetical protein